MHGCFLPRPFGHHFLRVSSWMLLASFYVPAFFLMLRVIVTWQFYMVRAFTPEGSQPLLPQDFCSFVVLQLLHRLHCFGCTKSLGGLAECDLARLSQPWVWSGTSALGQPLLPHQPGFAFVWLYAPG